MNDRLIADTGRAAKPAAPNMRLILALTVLVAAVGLFGFAGWFANGDNLFWSLVQAGLAWCL